jgi:Ca2+-binding EF-hand superfamily protein
VVELTKEGIDFFEQRFEEFDRDKDGCLSTAEQDEMFSTAPCRSAFALFCSP